MPSQSAKVFHQLDLGENKAQALSAMSFVEQQLGKFLSEKKADPILRPEDIEMLISQSQSQAQPAISSTFYLSAKRQWRDAQLAREYPSIVRSERLKSFVVHEPHEVDLVLDWEAQDSGRKGSAFVFGISGAPAHRHLPGLTSGGSGKQTRSLYAQTAQEAQAMWRDILNGTLCREDNPVEITVRAPRQAPHDFSQAT